MNQDRSVAVQDIVKTMGQENELVFLTALIGVASRGAMTAKDERAWRKLSAAQLRDAWTSTLRELRIDVVFEVGAREAEASIEFVESGGHAIAIEANPFTFEQLTSQAEKFGVDVRNVAVGSTESVMDFMIPLAEYNPGLMPGDGSLLTKNSPANYERLEVKVTTVDMLWKEVSRDAQVALWIDVEGTAYECLTGASKLLESGSCRLVFAEVETHAFWENQKTAEDVVNLLGRYGYAPVLRDAEYRDQFNVLFAQKKDLTHLDNIIADYWSVISGLRNKSRFLRLHSGLSARLPWKH